jgi:uncharacterized protein with GYD domain
MATYVMLSRLTAEGAKTVKENPERIKEVDREVEALGARVSAQYALLGSYDFLTVLEAPDPETVARVSVELGRRGTAKYESMAAIPIETFVNMLKQR